MAPHGIDSGDELGDEDQEPVEELPIRVEPMPQLGAAPADVERALRLIERCRLRGADEVEEVRRILKEGAPAGFITTSGWTPVAAAAFVGNNNVSPELLEFRWTMHDGQLTTFTHTDIAVSAGTRSGRHVRHGEAVCGRQQRWQRR